MLKQGVCVVARGLCWLQRQDSIASLPPAALRLCNVTAITIIAFSSFERISFSAALSTTCPRCSHLGARKQYAQCVLNIPPQVLVFDTACAANNERGY